MFEMEYGSNRATIQTKAGVEGVSGVRIIVSFDWNLISRHLSLQR